MNDMKVIRLLVFVGAAFWAQPAWAQWGNHCNLEITTPKAVGAAPNGLDSRNRVYYAYPGLEYNIPTIARCGRYPYTYSLTGAPGWMSVDSDTGIISGTPTSTTTDDDSSITVRVTDADGDYTEETWGVDVTTTGWYFVDRVMGTHRVGNGGCSSSCGDGSLGNPWKNFDDVFDGTSTGDRVYFRGCHSNCIASNAYEYTLAGIAVDNADHIHGEERVTWQKAEVLLAYPGETPRLDFQYTGDGCLPWDNGPGGNQPKYNCGQSVPRFRFSGATHVWVDGWQTRNSMTIAFHFGRASSRGVMVRRCDMRTNGPGIDGGNSAFLSWTRSQSALTYGDVVDQCHFEDVIYGGGNSAIKPYDTTKMVVSRNTSVGGSGGTEALFAYKGGVSDFTHRANTHLGIGGSGAAIGGNLADSDPPLNTPSSGEIAFNLVVASLGSVCGQGALRISQQPDPIGEFHVYRNTFIGAICLHNIDTGDGPLTFERNIIANNDGSESPWAYIIDSSVTDSTVVTLTQNLTSANDGTYVDTTTGVLTGSARSTYLGDYGFEIN